MNKKAYNDFVSTPAALAGNKKGAEAFKALEVSGTKATRKAHVEQQKEEMERLQALE